MKRLGSAVAIGVALLALYVARLDEIAGLYVDDAYYIVLAQSVAHGTGYALTSSATTPILPSFPPGFALLLAPVVAVSPEFPGNVTALKFVSIAAMFGVAWLTYLYFNRERGMDRARAGTIATITAVLPGFVFLATSTVMAECAFTLALVAAAVAIERAGRDSDRTTRTVIIAAAISAASWLIRSAGLAVVLTGIGYLAWRRGWRAAAAFVGVCAVCYGPWMLYARAHEPTPEERIAHGGAIVYSYGSLLSMRYGGDAISGSVGVSGVIARVAKNVFNVFGRDMGAVLLPAAYRGASESGQEVFQLSGESGLMSGSMGLGTPIVVTSTLLSLIVLIGWWAAASRRIGVAEVLTVLTIAMVVIVPARTFRYVLPVAPFLVSYFLAGVETVATRVRGATAAFPSFRIASASLLVLLLLEHVQYIAQKVAGPAPEWIADGRDVQAVGEWMNTHLPAGGGVASTNPALLYLMTGHKTLALVDPVHNWQRWRDSDIRYAVALHVASKPGSGLGYQVLYESPRLGLWVLELRQKP